MAKKIWLVGIGMGNRDTLTIGAWNILKNCDCLIGAQRMLDAFPELTCRRFTATAPEKIAAKAAGTEEALRTITQSANRM